MGLPGARSSDPREEAGGRGARPSEPVCPCPPGPAPGPSAGRALCPAGRWPPSCAPLQKDSFEHWSGGPAAPLPFLGAVCSSQLNQSEAKMPWWWWGGAGVYRFDFPGAGVLRVCPALSRRVLQELCKQEPWSGRKEPPAFASSPPRSPPPRLRVPRLPAREGPGPPAQGCRADAGQAKHRAAWGPAPPGLWVWAGGNWQARTAAAQMSRARADPLFSDPSVCFFAQTPRWNS